MESLRHRYNIKKKVAKAAGDKKKARAQHKVRVDKHNSRVKQEVLAGVEQVFAIVDTPIKSYVILLTDHEEPPYYYVNAKSIRHLTAAMDEVAMEFKFDRLVQIENDKREHEK